MGAGKTTFVAKELKKYPVTSPTFSIINQYAPNIFHADLYRIKNVSELYNTDFFDILYDDKNTFYIEWPYNNVPKEVYYKCKNISHVYF